MQGIVLTIIVISIAMWILSNLIRSGEDERKDPSRPQGRRPGGRGRGGPDIDRFLEEINRRRQQAERQPPRPAPPPPVQAAPAPVPAARQKRPRTRTEPVQVVKPAPRLEPRPASGRAPTADVVAVAEVMRVASAETAAPLDTSAPAIAPVVASPGRPRAAGLDQLLPLLRSPQAARTAVVLHEILGPPRCRRAVLPHDRR